MGDPRTSWYHERESAWLYRRLAAREPLPQHRALFAGLAEAAEQQARIWERQLAAAPRFAPRLRTRIVGRLIDRFGGRALRPMLAAMKLRGLSVYQAGSVIGGHAMPTRVEEVGDRHRGTGDGSLRAAVFGINDGLVSNCSLILGMAGAGADSRLVLMSGFAGLLAGSLSMASGEYVSVRSQREMYEYQIGLERAELEQYPEEEAAELALIYEARGIGREQARAVAAALIRQPEHALATLAREELGLNPDELGSPLGAAVASFVSFAIGALLPLLPLLIGVAASVALQWSCAVGLASLFTVGLVLSLYSGRNALLGGLRMMAIGALAATCTWGAGRIFGAIIA